MSEQPQFHNLTFDRRTRDGMTVVLVSRRALGVPAWDDSAVTNLTVRLLADRRKVRSVVPENSFTTAAPPHFHKRGVIAIGYQPSVTPREAMRLAREALEKFCGSYQTEEVTVLDGDQTAKQPDHPRARPVRRRPDRRMPNHVTA